MSQRKPLKDIRLDCFLGALEGSRSYQPFQRSMNPGDTGHPQKYNSSKDKVWEMWQQDDSNPVLMKAKCGGDVRGTRNQSIKLITYKQWFIRSEMTVTTSWWYRIASPDDSSVVPKFYLPENLLMHMFKINILESYFQRCWSSRYGVMFMGKHFKNHHMWFWYRWY